MHVLGRAGDNHIQLINRAAALEGQAVIELQQIGDLNVVMAMGVLLGGT